MKCVKCDACGKTAPWRKFQNGPLVLGEFTFDFCDKCFSIVDELIKNMLSTLREKGGKDDRYAALPRGGIL
jgi:hypothetical protein